MGGAVATIVRRESGEVIKMYRPLGSEKALFLNKHFLEKDFNKAIDQYLEPWHAMVQAYQADKEAGVSEKALSSYWASHDGFFPEDYGINVIDFKSKKIYTCQYYNTPGAFSVHELLDGLYSSSESPIWTDVINSNLACVAKNNESSENLIPIQDAFNIDSSTTIEAICESLLKADRHSEIRLAQEAGFQAFNFEENLRGHEALLRALIDDSFEITDDELNGWANYLVQQYAQIEDDEEGDETPSESEIRSEILAIVGYGRSLRL